MTSFPGQLWQRIVEAFSRTDIPEVSLLELSLVLLMAIALSVPRVTWRYFGLLAPAWSGCWGYPVPAMTGAALVSAGFGGWGPAALATGTLILLASLLFI